MSALRISLKESGHHVRPLIAYTLTHMCIDFVCFFVLCRGFQSTAGSLDNASIGFLVYNVVSYGLQPFIGYLTDRYRYFPAGIVGCLIVMFSVTLISFRWLAIILAAVGAAFFHVGGGVDTLRHAEGRMWRAGIFISTGAFGGGLGIMAASSSTSLLLPIIMICISIIFISLWGQPRHMGTPRPFGAYADIPFVPVLIFTPLSVILRAFVGCITPIPWRDTTFLMLLPYICGGCGKVLGGFLGDALGAKNVSLYSLLLSIPFLCFGAASPSLEAVGLLFFNMITPITLSAIVTKLPNNPGLAFGIVRLSTLVGVSASYFVSIPNSVLLQAIAVLIILAAACTALSPARMPELIKDEGDLIEGDEEAAEPEKTTANSDV